MTRKNLLFGVIALLVPVLALSGCGGGGGYRDRQAGDLAAARRNMKPVSSPHVTRDAPKEKKYTWGTGLTQRSAHHYMGVGKDIPDYIDYQCVYFGIVGAVAFDLSVEGVPGSPDAANQWAENVAQAAAKITYANIGN